MDKFLVRIIKKKEKHNIKNKKSTTLGWVGPGWPQGLGGSSGDDSSGQRSCTRQPSAGMTMPMHHWARFAAKLTSRISDC